jgi:Flp pilus assembly protein TadD
VAALLLGILLSITGCGPSYRELRYWGQEAIADQRWGAARQFLTDAQQQVPGDPENLHDLGVCYMFLSRRNFEEGNRTAGMREADRAIDYFSRAIDARPGMRSAIIGKNRALKMKGQFDQALSSAHWAAAYVGPSAEQQVFLARQYEQRGDLDGALLRLRQAVAMEPNNAAPYRELAEFSDRHGKMEDAAIAYRKAYLLDPFQEDVADRLRAMGEEVPYVPPPSE